MFAVVPRKVFTEALRWFGLPAAPDEGMIMHSQKHDSDFPQRGKVIA